jgi:hypothetical protein
VVKRFFKFQSQRTDPTALLIFSLVIGSPDVIVPYFRRPLKFGLPRSVRDHQFLAQSNNPIFMG